MTGPERRALKALNKFIKSIPRKYWTAMGWVKEDLNEDNA